MTKRKQENKAETKDNHKEAKNQPKITSFFKPAASPAGTPSKEPEQKRRRRGTNARRPVGPPGRVLAEVTLGSDDEFPTAVPSTSATAGGVYSPNDSLEVSENDFRVSQTNSESDIKVLEDPMPSTPRSSPFVFAVFRSYEEAINLASTLSRTPPKSNIKETSETGSPKPTLEYFGASTTTESHKESERSKVQEIRPPGKAEESEVDNDGNDFSDDGCQVLSGIDLDVVGDTETTHTISPVKTIDICLSQNSSPSILQISPFPSKISPKAKLNHLSPVRHLRKKPTSVPKRQLQFPEGPANFPLQQTGSQYGDGTAHPQQKEIFLSENFREILDSVLSGDDLSLFSRSDIYLCQEFRNLSNPAMCLFLRLYNRTMSWYRQCKITYQKIAEDLAPLFQELHSSEFLTELKEEPSLPELKSLLTLLDLEEVKMLAKDMKLNGVSQSRNKSSYMAELLKMAKTQRTLSKTDFSQVVTKAVLDRLGSTFKVSEKSRNLFSRVLVLYSLPRYWDDETQLGSNHMTTLSLTKSGKMEYPQYTVSKSRNIYRDHDDLVRFCEGISLHSQIQANIDDKRWDVVLSLHQNIMEKLKLLPNPNLLDHDESLPSFLRIYTAGSVLTRAAWIGVDSYQKTKRYEEANEVIEYLLNQNPKMYLSQYRGRWHERFILNSKHLKKSSVEIKEFVIQGLSDRFVREHDKLSFTSRLRKIQQEENKKKRKEAEAKKKSRKIRRRRRVRVVDSEDSESSDDTEIIEHEDYFLDDERIKMKYPSFRTFETNRPISEKTVDAEQLKVAGDGERIFGKSTFLGRSGTADSLSTVERRALSFYEEQGYRWGIHAEGSVPVCIFGLLFWDIIYKDEGITDVFRGPFQAFPLDLHFDEFYEQRETLIRRRLNELRYTWSLFDAFQVLENNWTYNFGKLCLIQWNVFDSVDQLKSLVKSLGLALVANISERLASNFRHYQSGFPDLVVWNESDYMFVEVKGPGDKLSTKQIVWLDFLISVGANAEMCRIKSVSNKRIRVNK